MPPKIPRLLWLAVPVAYLLYLFRLTGFGLIGPDEPRYAAIAREMAHSGDWITPRLWGQPWFEKPALLYWMSGAAFRLGLGPELAPRLPVALLSIAFLGFFWWIVRREFGCGAASLATIVLGTSAAWIGFSQVGVTDLPLTAAFSAAMLLALPWIAKREVRMLPAASAALGLAVLAKGFLPLALAAPLALRIRWFRDLLRPTVVVPFLVVALPWYTLCYLRNGAVFLHDFIVVHHLERFTQTGLQHVQPWWFYVPRLPALLLPWTPLLLAVRPRAAWSEPRQRFLLAWFAFGLVFFSASTNKLPGYLLPLLPPLAILMALGLERSRRAGMLLVCCALLLAAYPIAAPLLATAMANLWAGAPRVSFQWTWLLPLIPAVAAWMLERRGRRIAAAGAIAVATAIAIAGLKWTAGPAIDQMATARDLSRAVAQHRGNVCLEPIRRDWQYGLSYYAGTGLPECASDPKPFHVMQKPGFPPQLAPAFDESGTIGLPAVVDRRRATL
jgi:4-amino-4-deoxy-L-arabinose transferase-like glycosyltransferase